MDIRDRDQLRQDLDQVLDSIASKLVISRIEFVVDTLADRWACQALGRYRRLGLRWGTPLPGAGDLFTLSLDIAEARALASDLLRWAELAEQNSGD
ncbi:MAG: hypothetical protein JJ992_16340 [Planctomycetes bacterium]|nr:hypothetical protein [Planctomycetota bacterium]